MKVLVTGGAGFIGSHIVDQLITAGHSVVVVDNLVTGKQQHLNPEAVFHELDIVSPLLGEVFLAERPEIVFHEAAQASVKASMDDPRYDANVNVVGLVNVLESCVEAGARKVLFASSGATFGNPEYLPMDEAHPQRPESPYGITKMVAEHYLQYYARDRGLPFTALRYGNVYGPRQDSQGEAGVVAIFARMLLTGQTPTIHWDGEQTRDYIHVDDVARANLAAMNAGDGRIYCIGTEIPTSVNRIFELVRDAADVDVVPNRGPRRPGDLRDASFNCQRARIELGWQATVPLKEGIESTVAWCRADLASGEQSRS